MIFVSIFFIYFQEVEEELSLLPDDEEHDSFHVLFLFFVFNYSFFSTHLPYDDEEHDSFHVLAKSYIKPRPWILNYKC